MEKQKRITQDVFLNALVCPRLGWFIRRGVFKSGNTLSERVRNEQEKEIKRKIRKQFPSGVHVSEENFNAALEKTLLLLDKKDVRTIYDAAFAINGYGGRADIIVREDGSWHLYEIKPAIQVRQKFLDDIAYTAMMMQGAKLRISTASLVLLSRDYRLGMGDERLFESIDCTEKIRSLSAAFEVFMEPIDSLTSGINQPKVNLIYECKNCTFFSQCIGTEQEGHIFNLPRLTEPKFRHLSKLRVSYVFDIPREFPLTDRQKIALRCMETGKPYIGSHLGEKLGAISWPGFYLDFQSIMTPVPLYESIAPFERIPISYSIHKCERIGIVTDHREYLANPDKDYREEFTEGLVKHLGKRGSIMVYAGREKEIIGSLAKAFPRYADRLNAVVERSVDLESIIGDEFYHPDFRGSTSMRNTTSVLARNAFPRD